MKKVKVTMVAFLPRACILLHLIIIISIPTIEPAKSADFKDVKEWGASFANKLVNDLNVASHFAKISGIYSSNINSSSTTKVDYGDELEMAVADMGKLVQRRIGALNAAVAEAEAISTDFPFDATFFEEPKDNLNSR